MTTLSASADASPRSEAAHPASLSIKSPLSGSASTRLRDGTVQIEMRLLPDEAERVWQAPCEHRRALASRKAPENENELETETETKCQSETDVHPGSSEDVSAETGEPPTMADAAVAMAERALADTTAQDNSGADRRLPFVHLAERRLSETTSETADEPWNAELRDGTALHGESLLRLACDCGLLVAKTDDRGGVLDLGRRRRTVSPALMRAVRLRDRGCRFPGCRQRAFVDAHHIEHWAKGGATCLDNVVLLCPRHHVAVHEGGFRVTRSHAGELRFFRPDGAHLPALAPAAPSTSAQDVAARLAARRHHADAQAMRPHGRGWRVELRGCVRALCRRLELYGAHEVGEVQ